MKQPNLKSFEKFKIKNPQAILGGFADKGPIRRDKLKRPKHGF
ncbi:hypothetical protein ACFSYG_04600 [Leeuwenhoekiella polynyae]|uniref:Uncharacterized protein n=1 Tax=Leeuwenhoekiella polynyae TaxID=1550906 RepID=A0A4Q0P345_9FLAO|nr:hypothetical protein DSM02_2364 [Leeuwenhoekiella polynyae]